MTKSPFLLIHNFISPLECEQFLSNIDGGYPDFDDEARKTLKMIQSSVGIQSKVWSRMEEYFDFVEDYYGVEIKELSALDIEIYPEKSLQEPQRCENSLYDGKSWRIRNDYDFTVVVFLKDYNESKNFDPDFEVYGGKLNIVNHQFAFNPNRGVAVVFPSNQYFINQVSPPAFGDAIQFRFHIICEPKFKYNPKDYEGNHQIWFKGLT